MADELVRSSTAGRLTLLAVTLASGSAILDGSIVNIALPRLGESLHASLAQLQWVVNGYLLALASLILIGGSIGDRHGRRRTFAVGTAGFGVFSLACAVAQTPEQLIAARVLQGVAAALMTPGSLAIIQASFRPEDRAPAIGWWAGVSGITTAIGPFVGGFLLDHGGWRGIFVINVPLCIAVLVLSRWIPESRSPGPSQGFDVRGAVLGVIGLGGLTYALTIGSTGSVVEVGGSAAIGVVALAGFVLAERRPGAMAPVALFASRVFTAANVMTFLVYAAMGSIFFFLVLQLQITVGYSPLQAGMASLPVTLSMLLLSSRFAAIGARTGPRVPMTVGPLVCAVGVALMVPIGADTSYWTGVLPGMVCFALGLTFLVSPLTAAVLAAAPGEYVGAASGINNALARAGSLLSVAALPAAVGISGTAYRDPTVMTSGFRTGMIVCAALLAGGGIVSWFGLRRFSADAPGAESDDPTDAATG